MSLNTYDIGEDVELIGRFADPDDNSPVSPGVVTVTLYRPDTDEEVAGPAPVEGPAGTFTATFAPDAAGRWHWKMDGDAGVVAIERGQFHVRPDVGTP